MNSRLQAALAQFYAQQVHEIHVRRSYEAWTRLHCPTHTCTCGTAVHNIPCSLWRPDKGQDNWLVLSHRLALEIVRVAIADGRLDPRPSSISIAGKYVFNDRKLEVYEEGRRCDV